jgi:hypothetical protein
MRARALVLCFALGFGVTLALLVGRRLSAEALGVMVGVLAGVAASLPMGLIVAWLALRMRGPSIIERTVPVPTPAGLEPRVVVVAQPPFTPGLVPARPAYTPPDVGGALAPLRASPPAPAPAREFTVIGGTESDWEPLGPDESREALAWQA